MKKEAQNRNKYSYQKRRKCKAVTRSVIFLLLLLARSNAKDVKCMWKLRCRRHRVGLRSFTLSTTRPRGIWLGPVRCTHALHGCSVCLCACVSVRVWLAIVACCCCLLLLLLKLASLLISTVTTLLLNWCCCCCFCSCCCSGYYHRLLPPPPITVCCYCR